MASKPGKKPWQWAPRKKPIPGWKRPCNFLKPYIGQMEVVTAAGEMGENVARSLGFSTRVIYTPATEQTEAHDTEQTARLLLNEEVDLLLFAGR